MSGSWRKHKNTQKEEENGNNQQNWPQLSFPPTIFAIEAN